MTPHQKRIVFFLLAVTSNLFLQQSAFAQADSTAQAAATAASDSVGTNSISTGHSYFGFDLGITGSDYIGSKNFLWGIETDPSLKTYLPYNSLGTGIGFVGGIKAGLST